MAHSLARRPPMVIDAPPPTGSRPLGLRMKPSLRLAIGYRNEAKRGAPTKVDHFLAKDGQENEYAAAARKFREVYADAGSACDCNGTPHPKVKAINIRLMASLTDSLSIKYMAYAGGGDGEGGGVLTAIGDTNFAEYDFMGGPDVLTIFKPNGDVAHVETAGVDALTGEPLDAVARDLGLALYTTFRFGIPDVLGYGSMCEITTKGKQSTDLIWSKLVGWYGTFGDRTPWVMKPKLIVRPGKARPVVKKRGEDPKRISTRIYVLDLVIPETEDAMLERLRDFKELTSSHVATLYGGDVEPRALEAPAVEGASSPHESAPTPQATAPVGPPPGAVAPGPQDAAGESSENATATETANARSAPAAASLDADPGSDAPPPDLSSEPAIPGVEPTVAPAEEVEPPIDETVDVIEGDAVEEDDDALSAEEQAALPAALAFKLPSGSFQGRTLGFLVEQGDSAGEWIAYGLRQKWVHDPGFLSALALVCKAHRPELYAAWRQEVEGS